MSRMQGSTEVDSKDVPSFKQPHVRKTFWQKGESEMILNENDEKVHHAIIDLYEVHDAGSVTVRIVSDHIGMSERAVERAMQALESMGIVERKEEEVVLCDNCGYYPLAGRRH